MFQVRLFGYFVMTKDNLVMNEASMRSPQLLKLLVYLIINRKQASTNYDLEQYLWEEMNAGGQADALKNLIYRLRKLLCDNFGKGDYIITGRGNYQWNSQYELDVDIDKFEEAYNEYQLNASTTCRDEAISIYKGIFLKSYEAKYWAKLGIKFQSMFLQLVKDCKEEMLMDKRYPELEKLCTKVLDTDPFDEEWNRCFINVLLLENKPSHAQKYYNGLEKKIQSQSGIQKTNLLRALKMELSENRISDRVEIGKFMETIHEELCEKKSYKLELDDFKKIVKLQVYKDARRNSTSYCILFSMEIETGSIDGAVEVQDFLMNMAMNELDKILLKNLRSCDVFSQCSISQYITLLDNCNYEFSLKVAKRISDIFMEMKSSKISHLYIDIMKIN